jgi:acetyl esterase
VTIGQLHPQAAAFVENQRAYAGATELSLDPLKVRRHVAHFADLMGPREDVESVFDVVVPGSGWDIPVRVYVPVGERPCPVAIYFHGGGWVGGSLDVCETFCRALANRSKCVVAAVGYRLAPENRFPAAVDDCATAANWIAQNCHEWGSDPSRLALVGDSAGGNLVAAVALTAVREGEPAIALQVLLYPALDPSLDTDSHRVMGSKGFGIRSSDMRFFWNNYAPDADSEDWRLSPTRAPDLSDMPAALVLTAEFDPLRDEGEFYAARLRSAGVPVGAKRWAGQIHGFLWMAGILDDADLALTYVAQEMRAKLQ